MLAHTRRIKGVLFKLSYFSYSLCIGIG